MGRLPANQTSKAHDGVISSRFRGMLGGDRNLERAWHADDRHVLGRHAGFGKRGQRPGLQPVRHEVVVFRDDQREAESTAAPTAFDECHGGTYSGNGYISQPSTNAEAMKAANIFAPSLACSRTS